MIDVMFNPLADRARRVAWLAQKFLNEENALAAQCSITFKGIEEIPGKEKLHNRYVLTDIDGVSMRIGLGNLPSAIAR